MSDQENRRHSDDSSGNGGHHHHHHHHPPSFLALDKPQQQQPAAITSVPSSSASGKPTLKDAISFGNIQQREPAPLFDSLQFDQISLRRAQERPNKRQKNGQSQSNQSSSGGQQGQQGTLSGNVDFELLYNGEPLTELKFVVENVKETGDVDPDRLRDETSKFFEFYNQNPSQNNRKAFREKYPELCTQDQLNPKFLVVTDAAHDTFKDGKIVDGTHAQFDAAIARAFNQFGLLARPINERSVFLMREKLGTSTATIPNYPVLPSVRLNEGWLCDDTCLDFCVEDLGLDLAVPSLELTSLDNETHPDHDHDVSPILMHNADVHSSSNTMGGIVVNNHSSSGGGTQKVRPRTTNVGLRQGAIARLTVRVGKLTYEEKEKNFKLSLYPVYALFYNILFPNAREIPTNMDAVTEEDILRRFPGKWNIVSTGIAYDASRLSITHIRQVDGPSGVRLFDPYRTCKIAYMHPSRKAKDGQGARMMKILLPKPVKFLYGIGCYQGKTEDDISYNALLELGDVNHRFMLMMREDLNQLFSENFDTLCPDKSKIYSHDDYLFEDGLTFSRKDQNGKMNSQPGVMRVTIPKSNSTKIRPRVEGVPPKLDSSVKREEMPFVQLQPKFFDASSGGVAIENPEHVLDFNATGHVLIHVVPKFKTNMTISLEYRLSQAVITDYGSRSGIGGSYYRSYAEDEIYDVRSGSNGNATGNGGGAAAYTFNDIF